MMSVPERLLSRKEEDALRKATGTMASPLYMTVAQLYLSGPSDNDWRDSGLAGALLLVFDRRPPKARVIRLVTLETAGETVGGRILFEQEMYEGMIYRTDAPDFHSFQTPEARVGLAFPSEIEARQFASKVKSFIPKVSEESKSSGGGGLFKIFKKKKATVSGPTAFKHTAHVGFDAEKGFDPSQLPAEWKMLFKSAGIKKSHLTNPDTAALINNIVQQHRPGPAAPPRPAPHPQRSPPALHAGGGPGAQFYSAEHQSNLAAPDPTPAPAPPVPARPPSIPSRRPAARPPPKVAPTAPTVHDQGGYGGPGSTGGAGVPPAPAAGGTVPLTPGMGGGAGGPMGGPGSGGSAPPAPGSPGFGGAPAGSSVPLAPSISEPPSGGPMGGPGFGGPGSVRSVLPAPAVRASGVPPAPGPPAAPPLAPAAPGIPSAPGMGGPGMGGPGMGGPGAGGPSAGGPGGSSRGALLSDISKGGFKLRKAPPPNSNGPSGSGGPGSAGVGGDGGAPQDLLAAIRAGKQLRKAPKEDPSDKGLPSLSSMGGAASNSLMAALRGAMANRFNSINDGPASAAADDDSDDDDW